MDRSKMNLLMAINRKYIDQMKALLYSLGENNDSDVDVYLIHRELKEDDIEDLQRTVQYTTKGALYEIELDDAFLPEAKVGHHFSIEMYYRIFASEFLPTDINRILWLDADIIINNSLCEFYFQDFHGKSMVVCAHRERNKGNPIISLEAKERLRLMGDEPYFNSGVILMNLEKIRREFNRDAVSNLILQMEDILNYPDQDILNILYRNDVLWADYTKYNFQIHYDWKMENEKEHIQKNVVIIHYAGPAKPWEFKSRHFSHAYYWKYYLKFGKRSVYNKIQFESILYAMYISLKRLRKGK